MSNKYIMDIPKGVHNDADALAAWHIYTQHWPSSTPATAGQSDPVPVKDTAKELKELITSSADAYECIYGSIDALEKFFDQNPSAIDFGLEILRKTFSELPDSVQHNYGKGPEGAENILKWYLVELSSFFQGNVPPHQIGAEDTMKSPIPDASNVRFSHQEVIESREAVLEKVEGFQKARLDIIILLAMQGRCHSMNFARLHRSDDRADYIGGNAVITINNMLDRKHAVSPLWSKADFVGCCILLRSCAKSLLETIPTQSRYQALATWKEEFATFLHDDEGGKNVDDDFVVKVHAARVLRNLEKGPRDEGSAELFLLKDWVF